MFRLSIKEDLEEEFQVPLNELPLWYIINILTQFHLIFGWFSVITVT